MPSRWVTERWTRVPGSLDPDEILAHPPTSAFTLLHGAGRFVILGETPLAHLGTDDLNDLHWERVGDPPPIRPDLLGFVTYERGYDLDPILPPPFPVHDPLPDLRFTIHRYLTAYDRATGQLHRAERHLPPELDLHPHALGSGPLEVHKVSDTDTPSGYADKVTRIRSAIAEGRVYQVNLTRQECWAVRGSLASLARKLHALDPAPYSALLADPAFTILSGSPECFLRWGPDWIQTCPIKGTAPRHPDPATDEAIARALLSSSKELSELAMIVDLLRNDLARLCRMPSVRVDAFPRLERYAHVHHLVADLTGALEGPPKLDHLLKALFPGGSVTGCPKLAAMTLIRELEVEPRRIYCGALGWMAHDRSEGTWALPIRTAWAWGDQLRFGVGGGVVWDSDPKAEYDETVHKSRSLLACLRS